MDNGELQERSRADLLRLEGMGHRFVAEVEDALAELGLSLRAS